MKNKGFTLIEVIIVVTIVGILAAIAVPTYQNKKSNEVDGKITETGVGQTEVVSNVGNKTFPIQLHAFSLAEKSNYVTKALEQVGYYDNGNGIVILNNYYSNYVIEAYTLWKKQHPDHAQRMIPGSIEIHEANRCLYIFYEDSGVND